MKIYPQNLTYEIPLSKDDYIRINIDLTVNRLNNLDYEYMKDVFNNVFEKILKQFDPI